jgi:hypothetical protein
VLTFSCLSSLLFSSALCTADLFAVCCHLRMRLTTPFSLHLACSWIPRGDGYSLYIRPTMISTHPYVGVAKAQQAKLYVSPTASHGVATASHITWTASHSIHPT